MTTAGITIHQPIAVLESGSVNRRLKICWSWCNRNLAFLRLYRSHPATSPHHPSSVYWTLVLIKMVLRHCDADLIRPMWKVRLGLKLTERRQQSRCGSPEWERSI